MTSIRTTVLAAALGVVLPQSALAENTSSFEVAQACGWYAIVGCSRDWNGASSIAPPGTQIIDTNLYPNFRNGWFCAADGPYPSQAVVPLWRWKQFHSDAYAKSAC